jgi:hypothetical protein
MISLLVWLLILALVLGVVWWVITLLPLPPPVVRIAQVIIAVIFVIVLIDLVLGIPGLGLSHSPYATR